MYQCCHCRLPLSAGRRSAKLVSLVTSLFSATYAIRWQEHFPETPLQSTPMFDGRAVCYPTDETLRDYLAWRQADTHINNQASRQGWCTMIALDGSFSPFFYLL